MQVGRINGPALADNLLREGVDLAVETDLLVFDVTNMTLSTSGNIQTSASTATRAGLNIPEGVAPTVPVDGDMWVTAAGEFFVRLNGVTTDVSAGDLITDTSPQLGANLDVNGFSIVSADAVAATPINITAGNSSGAYYGGDINLTGGIAEANDQYGGFINITGGDATYAGDAYAGNVNIAGGVGVKEGGDVNIDGGESPYNAGGVRLRGAEATDTGGYGGSISLTGGRATDGYPGSISIQGGLAVTSGDGGYVRILGGSTPSGAGGNIQLSPGNAVSGTDGAILIARGASTPPVELRFVETTTQTIINNGTYNYVGFVAPAVLAGNVIWTLPLTDSTGTQSLVSDGSGTLSWATVGEVINDTTPQLGGNLDVNDFDIVGSPAGATEAGGPIDILAAAGGATSGDGGAVTITGGSATDGYGGDMTITAGAAGGAGFYGGDLSIAAGASTSSYGGNVTIDGGDGGGSYDGGGVDIRGGNTATGAGGSIFIQGGFPSGAGSAGGIIIRGGGSSTATSVGDVTISGGIATGAGVDGGDVTLTGGQGQSTGAGGNAIVRGGHSTSTGAAGAVSIYGRDGNENSAGGPVTITSGDGGSTSGNAGDITLTPGSAAGSGSAGAINITQTAAPAVTTDKLYNVAGDLTWNGSPLALTTSATVQTINATPADIINIDIPSGESITATIRAHGHEAATGDTYSTVQHATARNASGTTTLVGTVTTAHTANDAGASGWTIVTTADDTSDTLDVTVTGEAAHTIDWSIKVDFTLG